MTKRIVLFSIIGALLLTGLVLAVGVGVLAIRARVNKTTIANILENRVGVSQTLVIDSNGSTISTQNQTNFDSSVDTALKNGSITQKQADIIKALYVIRIDQINSSTATTTAYQSYIISLLKAKNVTATADDLNSLGGILQNLGFETGGRTITRGMYMMR